MTHKDQNAKLNGKSVILGYFDFFWLAIEREQARRMRSWLSFFNSGATFKVAKV
jgi:hypothetical protein